MPGEEVANSTSGDSCATMATEQQQAASPNPNEIDAVVSVEAIIQSSAVQGGAESTCNNNVTTYAVQSVVESTSNNGTTSSATVAESAVSTDGDREKAMAVADELMAIGSKSVTEDCYDEAAECFSRALEIRVVHYGELAVECVNAYYKYGRALLYKSQEESDPLGAVPKKESDDKQVSFKDAVNGESSFASVSSNNDQAGSSNPQEEAANDASGGKDNEDDSADSDADEGEEDESDLDLAWKMLDIARAIAEKHSGDTLEKVDILSALAEVSLEREDIETALSDYQKALLMLERIVEPDSRQIAALNFQISLCLELGSRAPEAIPYCEKAISICKSRLQRLMNEVKMSSEPANSSTISEVYDGVQQSSNGIQTNKTVNEKEGEVEALTDLLGDLEKKLEDLQQLASNPTSILSEILGSLSARAGGGEKSLSAAAAAAAIGSSQMGAVNSTEGFDSPTVSTAHTSGPAGVTHLGVVGRGVKRMTTNSGSAESTEAKRLALDPTSGKGEGSTTT